MNSFDHPKPAGRKSSHDLQFKAHYYCHYRPANDEHFWPTQAKNPLQYSTRTYKVDPFGPRAYRWSIGMYGLMQDTQGQGRLFLGKLYRKEGFQTLLAESGRKSGQGQFFVAIRQDCNSRGLRCLGGLRWAELVGRWRLKGKAAI